MPNIVNSIKDVTATFSHEQKPLSSTILLGKEIIILEKPITSVELNYDQIQTLSPYLDKNKTSALLSLLSKY